MAVIKGRKYILSGEFRKDQQKEVKKVLEKELGIIIVCFITSANTEFIEYVVPKKNRRWFETF